MLVFVLKPSATGSVNATLNVNGCAPVICPGDQFVDVHLLKERLGLLTKGVDLYD